MKQLLQNMRDGKAVVVDTPVPAVRPGMALIKTGASLVSAGTERMVVEFAEKSLLGKVQSRPDLARQVIDKARKEGIIPTLESTFNRLDQPMALGYSSAGTVLEVGEGVTDFKPGDRVACAGGGYAVHAEYAVVPKNLMVKIPDQVDFESAAFSTLGAIALQGFRLAQPQLGDRVAVIGLGLLGLLMVGIAKAAGCSVFGIDINPAKVALAQQMGVEAVERQVAEAAAKNFTNGVGFDTVLICADTSTNDPIQLAGVISRDRGTIVAVGAVGLEIPRKIYYEKELQVYISRSYGPGRYDPAYEEQGKDYPIGYVRWTEGRNLEAFVGLIADQKISLKPLITHRFAIAEAARAYDVITGKTKEPFLGVVLTYPVDEIKPDQTWKNIHYVPSQKEGNTIGLGILGAGNYANAMFLPSVQKTGGVNKINITTASGLSARHAAEKYGFQTAGSSEEEFFTRPEINTVAVLTRHNLHAKQVIKALTLGKHVYCEKPLAINEEELDQIIQTLNGKPDAMLMVGFNRRFAPLAEKLKKFLSDSSAPVAIHYTVNAGFLPLTHWLHDPEQGGGRIIGEGCHFIDFLTFLTGEIPISVKTEALPDQEIYREDNVLMTFRYPNGSIGSISYLANGDKSFPKERIEVFSNGKIAILNDFRSLELVEKGKNKKIQSPKGQDKGHAHAWRIFIERIKNNLPAPIPYVDLIGVTKASFCAVDSLHEAKEINIV
ncbi:MAG: bi-domain-containing oxidoreductase [Anaerolineaceae bacterium]